MSGEIISKRLRSLLAEHMSGNYVLREIERDFEDAGIEYKPGPTFTGGQRRTMVAGYCNSLDFTKPVDARKFLDVLTVVLIEEDRKYELTESYRSPAWSNPLPPLDHPMGSVFRELSRCGFEWRDRKIVAVSASARLADAKSFANVFDLNHLAEHIQRIENAIDTDPRQAIGSAKELVETVAKTILTKRGKTYERGDDILELGKAVFKILKQVPDDVPDAAKGAAVIKRVLNNLATLVQGVAELRGFYGTGHGQDGKAKGLGMRHAKLAVGAAATLATYWLETDRETPKL